MYVYMYVYTYTYTVSYIRHIPLHCRLHPMFIGSFKIWLNHIGLAFIHA